MRSQSYINTFKGLFDSGMVGQPVHTMLRLIMENYTVGKVTTLEEIMLDPSIARADPITESRLGNHLTFLAEERVVCARVPGSIGWCTGKATVINSLSEISFNWFFVADYRAWMPSFCIPATNQKEKEVKMNINQTAAEPLDNPADADANIATVKTIFQIIKDHGGDSAAAAEAITSNDFSGSKSKVLTMLQILKAFGVIDYTLAEGYLLKVSLIVGNGEEFIAALLNRESSAFEQEVDATDDEPPAVVIIRLMGISFTVKEVQDLYWTLMDRIEYLEDKGTKHSTILSKVGITDDVEGMKEMINLIHGTELVTMSKAIPKTTPGQIPGPVSSGGYAEELRDALRADVDSFDRRRLIQPANPIGENDIMPFHVNSDRFTNLANFRYTDYARLMDNHRDTSIDQEFLITLIKRGISEKDLRESTKDESINRQYKSMTDIMQSHLVIRPTGSAMNPMYHFTEAFKDHWNTFVGSGATRLPDCRI